jgi:hypothetical protein
MGSFELALTNKSKETLSFVELIFILNTNCNLREL